MSEIPSAPPSEELTTREAEAFVVRAGGSLHSRGVPSFRLEEALHALSARLGLTASFFATPTGLFASFEKRARPDVYLLRVESTSSDLGKLADIDAITTGVVRGRLTAAQGLAELERVESAPARYGPPLMVAAYAVNSAAASVFFGAGLREIAVAFIIGLCTGLLAHVSGRDGGPWRAFEAVAAFTAAMLATVGATFFGPVSVSVAVIGGLVALLPGYTLTVAMSELARGHLASGSARITAAFMAFATLGFGVALGTKATDLILGGTPIVVPEPLPAWAELVALAFATSTFGIIFRAKREDILWIVLVSVLGFSGARVGSATLGPELGAFVGSLVVAMASNLYARVFDRPAVVPLFPGIMLLVPGSIGFRSLSSLMAHDVVSGVQTAFTMMLVAVALVAGLLLAHELLPAKRPL